MNVTYLASSLLNPCPDSQGLGLMTTNGTSYLICDTRFPHESHSLYDSSAQIGLGVGIGFGVAAFLLTTYKFVNGYLENKIYRKKSHLSDSSDDSGA